MGNEQPEGGDDAPTEVDRMPRGEAVLEAEDHTRVDGRARAEGDSSPTRKRPRLDAADRAPTPPSAPVSEGASAQPGSGTPSSALDSARLSASTRTKSLVSPTETLRFEEVRRTRAFAVIALPFAVACLLSLPLLGGDAKAKLIFGIGLVLVASGSLGVRLMLRTDESFHLPTILAFGYVCIFGAFTGVYYFGAFSPAPAIIPFGLYFFSVGQSFRATLAIYLSCALVQAALGVLVMTNTIVDRGLITLGGLDTAEAAVVLVLVELIFLATYLIARASRRALLFAIEQHDHDVRGLAQREALLKEARQELERALAAGGLGRFSEQILGGFRLGRVIGRGGMGEVYEAVETSTQRPAAVKLLHAAALGDPGPVQRFYREAKIASSLRVPHVVEVFAVGGPEAPVPFIAMERLFGQDLADVLRRERRLSIGRVTQLVRQVGRGLAAAREHGIVHRDLKPRNVFLAKVGDKAIWKVLDFGVSKLADGQATLTRDQLVGTPAYMAPEQAKGDELDHRADLYSLGVICYRALTGRPAFSADTIAETLHRVLTTMPPAPSETARLGPSVDAVLLIAMAKDPTDRFESAEELAEALAQARKEILDPMLRERARRLADKHPWGARRLEL